MTQWLTVSMAAEYSTVSTDMIRAAVKSGDLKAYAIGKGREYRVTADDVDGIGQLGHGHPAVGDGYRRRGMGSCVDVGQHGAAGGVCPRDGHGAGTEIEAATAHRCRVE